MPTVLASEVSRFWARLRNPLLTAAPLLLLLIFLTHFACACTVVRLTRPVVRIGLVGPFQGQYRYVGYDAIYAARLAVREANAAGGVGGYSVELVAYDDRGTIEGARTAAHNLALDPQVVAVIGHFRDDATQAGQAVYEEAGVPLVVAGTVEGRTAEQGNWLCPLLGHLQSKVQGKINRDQGLHHVQWIGVHDQSADAAVEGCAEGIQISNRNDLPPSSDVAAVLLMLEPVDAGEALAALQEAGWEGLVAGGPALGSPLFSQIADPSHVVFASPYRWPEVEGRDAAFATAYLSLGPHIPRPGPFAISTYQAMQTILSAIEDVARLGSLPDRQALTQQLLSPSPREVFLYQWNSRETHQLLKRVVLDADG